MKIYNKNYIKQKVKIIAQQIILIIQKFIPFSMTKFLQNKIIYKPRIKHLGINEFNTPLFDTVFFEVRTRCNGTCSFCAASIQNEIREDISMPIELYKKVINELKTLKFSGRIAYHVNNDPLIFPQLSEFVEYARQNLPNAWIQILTNGKALTLKNAENLLKAGINELSINLYNDDFFAELPKSIQDINDNLIPKFYKSEQIKTGHGPDGSKNIFRFNVFRRKVSDILTSRAGTSPNKKEKSKMPRGFCEYPFTQFNITADGTVSKCCADFYFSDPMGNVNNKSVMEIWKGEKFNNVRRTLLQGKREDITTCRECDSYGSKKFYSNIAKFFYFLTK